MRCFASANRAWNAGFLEGGGSTRRNASNVALPFSSKVSLFRAFSMSFQDAFTQTKMDRPGYPGNAQHDCPQKTDSDAPIGARRGQT